MITAKYGTVSYFGKEAPPTTASCHHLNVACGDISCQKESCTASMSLCWCAPRPRSPQVPLLVRPPTKVSAGPSAGAPPDQGLRRSLCWCAPRPRSPQVPLLVRPPTKVSAGPSAGAPPTRSPQVPLLVRPPTKVSAGPSAGAPPDQGLRRSLCWCAPRPRSPQVPLLVRPPTKVSAGPSAGAPPDQGLGSPRERQKRADRSDPAGPSSPYWDRLSKGRQSIPIATRQLAGNTTIVDGTRSVCARASAEAKT
ncbi:vegetative cell wall protein gp1-like [Penaeus japonicus]|uniref:vegetative cell wall protein gp1-like n=1 Tax=Penaeus japonicus TaxID=27405 RepID=UPI001C7121F9|nr:vegetative cell wall protein gp1-like [Penaeus japonicus]